VAYLTLKLAHILFSSLPEGLNSLYSETTQLCPDASEQKRELLKELTENKKLSLWRN